MGALSSYQRGCVRQVLDVNVLVPDVLAPPIDRPDRLVSLSSGMHHIGSRRTSNARLLDHLIGARQRGRRNDQAEGLASAAGLGDKRPACVERASAAAASECASMFPVDRYWNMAVIDHFLRLAADHHGREATAPMGSHHDHVGLA